MNRRQLNFIRGKVAQTSGKVIRVLRDTRWAKRDLRAGTILRVIGRTSDNLHESQRGWVVVPPSGRGEMTILDSVIDVEGSAFRVEES